jgi:hypothetical protein
MVLYGGDFNDSILPTDSVMGHDIWSSSAVDLGHLLSNKYLPPPANNSHVFYCPSMEADGGMQPGPFGFIFEENGSQRGYDGWGQPGRVVNISYEYRVSLSETNSTNLKQVNTCNKLTQAGNMALVTDIISYGASRFAHVYRYQFVRGDLSVGVYIDRDSPPVWQVYGAAPDVNNDVMFLVLDHPFDYKTYLN